MSLRFQLPSALVAALVVLLGVASTASAQPCTESPADRRYCGTDLITDLGGPAGYGPAGQCLGPNDDGSSRAIDITSAFPDGLNFFGTTYREVYLNTNGNITFRGPLGTYTPRAFPVASQPMIAAYWADVDIRGSACSGFCSDCLASCANPVDNGVWYHLSRGRAVFTWDNVGYFRCSDERQMSFQIILTSAPGCGSGMSTSSDFSVEFRFNKCQWETGNASGGTGGFGGTPAQSGFDAGNSRDFVEIPGSRTSGIARILCQESNVDPAERGVWRFLVRGGVVMCPDAGEECTVPGQQGVCAIGRTSCVGGGTVCAPQFTSGPERCDNLDNDCDGVVDDGGGLCPEPQICSSGRCVEPCFEGGCLEGQTCTAAGACVETACVDVTCPEGQRCERGVCVAGCDGVTCPRGQTCLAGRCVDGCATIMCDPECEACDSGVCVARCTPTSCPAGQSCNADGVCRATACGAGCPPGQVCGPTGCVDACEGVRCPAGELCDRGMCVTAPPPPPPDAGSPSMDDSGVPAPDAYIVDFLNDAGMDASTGRPPVGRAGCNCGVAQPHAAGPGRQALVWLALAALGLASASRRRGR
jgi:MYXO-CTERM domain-containing protein